MKRILLAWELGGNFGHIAILLPLARHLRQRGHEILFVIKDSAEAGPLLDSAGFRSIPAPKRPAAEKRRTPPVSFIDILDRVGFDNPENLAARVTAWRDIFVSFQPDVILAQYAPMAVFAARLAGKPCLQLNTGFEYPPEVSPYPCFRPNLKLTKGQLLAREAAFLKKVNLFCAGNGYSPFANVQDVIKGDINLLATLPEMDHYRSRPDGPYIGPLTIVEEGVTMPWTGRPAHRIFLYLRTLAEIELILETLKKRSDTEVIACIPGISEKIVSAFAGGSIRISPTMVRLSEILADAGLVISHAGHGMMANALLAGVPMLMIPTTIEQYLLTRKMEQLGLGLGVRRDRIAEQFSATLRELLNEKAFCQRSQAMAGRYAGYDQQQVIERIANTVDRLPEWRKTGLD